MILRFFTNLFIIFSILAPASSWSKNTNTISVKQLEKFYHQNGYDEYVKRPSQTVPQIYLDTLPQDFAKIKDQEVRNKLFIKILTPLILKSNQEILKERAVVENLQTKLTQNKELNKTDTETLEKLALKYDAFTRFQGFRRHQTQIEKLLKKVDQIYPSILISVAAIETDWGTSRAALEGNNLYKELVWHSDQGLSPEGETEDLSYKIKIFPNLYESIQSYSLKFNNNVSFDHARYLRSVQRESNLTPSGKNISHSMLMQSPLAGYLGLIDYIIAYYKLMYIDTFRLETAKPKKL